MSLKTEIDRTNSNKEKTKKDKVNINSKLVSLGGQKATDLEDVPNKMDIMVKRNYKKVAKGTFNNSLYGYNKHGSDYVFEETKSIPLNLNFTPKQVFLSVKSVGYDYQCTNVSISSENNYDSNTSVGQYNSSYNSGRVYVKSISKEKIDLNFILLESTNSSVSRDVLTVQGPIEWVAIG